MQKLFLKLNDRPVKLYILLLQGFDELRCFCGLAVIYPPVPCGTKPPVCDNLCTRDHSCDHPVAHSCHSEPNCPPCTHLTQKLCFCGHEVNWLTFSINVAWKSTRFVSIVEIYLAIWTTCLAVKNAVRIYLAGSTSAQKYATVAIALTWIKNVINLVYHLVPTAVIFAGPHATWAEIAPVPRALLWFIILFITVLKRALVNYERSFFRLL